MSLESFRSWSREHPVIPVVVALVIIAGALVWIVSRLLPAGQRSVENAPAFFFDEASGKTLERPVKDVPPLPGATGQPTVVRAIYVTADGGKTTSLAYYLKYTDAGKQLMEKNANLPAGKRMYPPPQETLLRSPDETTWVPDGTPEADRVKSAKLPDRPGGGKFTSADLGVMGSGLEEALPMRK